MQHSYLFWFRTDTELNTKYPDGVVDDVDPGVAFALNNGEDCTTLFNDALTNFEVTVNLEDRSGHTIGSAFTVESRDVVSGNSVIVYVNAPEISNYKPLQTRVKLNISGDSEYTLQYIGETSYTVTVHHVCEGSAITADTEVVSQTVWEDESTSVTIEPEEVENYVAEAVTITVSGDCEYTLEYTEVTGPDTVDMGLPSGTLWAAWNVGAESPEEFGDFYAFGDITPRTSFTVDNYAWYNTGTNQYTKYNSTDQKTTLDPEDDIATLTYGGNWHIPSYCQYQELLSYTTTAYTTINGISGVQYTSTVNGNAIFLPMGGESSWADGPVSWSGQCGGFQTCNLAYSEYAHFMESGTWGCYTGDCPQYAGNMVRAVIGTYNDCGGGGE